MHVELEHGLKLDTGDEVSSNIFSALGAISAKKERNRGAGSNACWLRHKVKYILQMHWKINRCREPTPRQIPAVDRR